MTKQEKAAAGTWRTVAERWHKGTAPNILPSNGPVTMAFHEIDAAETQREWDTGLGKLIGALLDTDARAGWNPYLSEQDIRDMITAVMSRIIIGFVPPPRRPRLVVLARDDAQWLKDLSRAVTLADAVKYLATLRGLNAKQARARVLRAEAQLNRKFLRVPSWGGRRARGAQKPPPLKQ